MTDRVTIETKVPTGYWDLNELKDAMTREGKFGHYTVIDCDDECIRFRRHEDGNIFYTTPFDVPQAITSPSKEEK